MRQNLYKFIIGAMLPLAASCAMGELPGTDLPEGSMTFSPSLAGQSEVSSTPRTRSLDIDGVPVYLHISSEPMEGPQTKSAPVSSLHNSMTCFGYSYPVFGEWTGTTPNLFFDAECTKGTSWSFPSGDRKWPGAAFRVRVYGVSPHHPSGLSVVSTASTAGAPVIEFTAGTDIASQVDLLEGVSDSDNITEGIQDYDGKGGSDVSIGFRHALAGIKVKTSDFGFNGTITKVTLKGVYSKGRTEVMSGKWTGQSTPVDYVITPSLGVTASGDCTPAESYTMLLVPQTLGASSSLEVEFTQNGTNYSFSAPMAGMELKTNTLTTMRFCFNDSDVYTGIGVEGLSDFTNTSSSASQTISIKSYTVHNSGVTRAEPWTISGYSTNGGSTFTTTKPSWLTLSATSGSGSTSGENMTITVAARTPTGGVAIFVPSETEDINYNTALKAMSEVGTSSSPIDLSLKDYLGNDIASSTTANCYVVHQPGWYKIPLVYGNAVKNGATNSSAFYNATASTAFEDSWGAVFTASSSPYVKDHGSIASAEVLWKDTACGVDGISEDDNYLYFHIPAETIEQTNILLGVKDSDGKVAWSWHVWVTGRDLTPVTITNSSSVNFDIMPVALGWNGWGTEDSLGGIYAAQSCVIRLKHTNGSFTRDILVNCPEAPGSGGTAGSTVRGSSPYYQWGRKDPFISVGAPATGSNIEYSSSAGSQAQAHQNPKVHYNTSSDWNTNHFNYFWDADNTATRTDSPVVKTIYDPCPAGWNVPQYNTFTGFSISNVIGSFSKGYTFKKNSSDATGIFFPAAGYRSVGSASIGDVTSYGFYRLSVPFSSINGHNLSFSSGSVSLQNFGSRSSGYCVWAALSRN